MDPRRITVIDAARPLGVGTEYMLGYRTRDRKYLVMTSWNNRIPRSDAATPRTAEETMWVIGEVTLIERRLAMLIKKPMAPYVRIKRIEIREKGFGNGKHLL
jgi:hypothetical protein